MREGAAHPRGNRKFAFNKPEDCAAWAEKVGLPAAVASADAFAAAAAGTAETERAIELLKAGLVSLRDGPRPDYLRLMV